MAISKINMVEKQIIEEVVDTVTLTLTPTEAKYLHWLTGRCNGPSPAPNYQIWDALRGHFHSGVYPNLGEPHKEPFETDIPFIDICSTSWGKDS